MNNLIRKEILLGEEKQIVYRWSHTYDSLTYKLSLYDGIEGNARSLETVLRVWGSDLSLAGNMWYDILGDALQWQRQLPGGHVVMR